VLTINPIMLTIDPNMMSSLGAVGCLPTSPDFDLGQEKVSTMHPNITGGLGVSRIPARFLDTRTGVVGEENNAWIENGFYGLDQRHWIPTGIRIMV